jgi:uncharacterized membrane protein (UPF0136 family)
MARRLNAGQALAALGAVVLLVSLFLDWYEPGLSSWTVFELIDLTLAAIAVGVLVDTVGGLFGRYSSPAGERALVFLSAGALIIVAASLIQQPPAAIDSDPQVGAWLALAGTIVMLAGSLLRDLRVALVITPREDREPFDAVDEVGPRDDPMAVDETQPLEPRPFEEDPGR